MWQIMNSTYIFLFLAVSVGAIRLNKAPDLMKENLPPNQIPQSEDPELIKDKQLQELDMLAARIFGNEKDLDDGEARFIINELKEAGYTADEFESLALAVSDEKIMRPFMPSPRAYAIHQLSIKEEKNAGKDMSQLSDFGQKIPKIPRSWVEKLLKMKPERKTYRYMFSGSFYHNDLTYRKWLGPWVKGHFNKTLDYFRATDANGRKPIGEYDVSNKDKAGFRPKNCGWTCFQFDKTYWDHMQKSEFTLCPGGDAPYSFRFYEAMLAQSIPIIHSYGSDFSKKNEATRRLHMIGYDFKFADKYPHTDDIAMRSRNLKKFIRYQTWIEGDNNPEHDKKHGIKF